MSQDGGALMRAILIGKNHMRTPLRACGANVVNKCYKNIVFFHPSGLRAGGFWSRFGGQTASRHWKFCGRQSDSLKLDQHQKPSHFMVQKSRPEIIWDETRWNFVVWVLVGWLSQDRLTRSQEITYFESWGKAIKVNSRLMNGWMLTAKLIKKGWKGVKNGSK